jgi:hypothetical protein
VRAYQLRDETADAARHPYPTLQMPFTTSDPQMCRLEIPMFPCFNMINTKRKPPPKRFSGHEGSS